MQINGTWGAVCGPISDMDAAAICRGLGWWVGGSARNASIYERPAGTPTVAGSVTCNSSANGFFACSYATDTTATACDGTQVSGFPLIEVSVHTHAINIILA